MKARKCEIAIRSGNANSQLTLATELQGLADDGKDVTLQRGLAAQVLFFLEDLLLPRSLEAAHTSQTASRTAL